MKTYSILRAGALLGFACIAFSRLLQAAPVESKVQAVTVYADRALITRGASLEFKEAGVVEAEFSSLPLSLLRDSIQASGKGTAGVSILDVQVANVFLESNANDSIKALETELKELKAKKAELDDQAKALVEQLSYLDLIRQATVQPPAEGQTRPGIDEWNKNLDFQSETRAKIAKAQRELAPAQEALDAKNAATEARLSQLRGQGGKQVLKVVVKLQVEKPGKLDLTLGYIVPQASWHPVYEARLDSEAKTLELGYAGMVMNATGEEWKDVSMTLSTAKPSLGGSAPDLEEWVLDVPRPRPVALPVAQEMRMAYKSVDNLELSPFAVPASRNEGYMNTATMAGASISAQATSASFRITNPVTLKSDGTAQKVGITTLNRKASYEYAVTPKLQETAFLNASVNNDTDFPLLGGQVAVFLDGAFVASSTIKTIMPGELFNLALGADEGIAVKRRVVNRFTESAGLTSSKTRITYEYLITLTNKKRSAQKVILREPVPVSRNEKIVVEMLQPKPEEIGDKDKPKPIMLKDGNRLMWTLELKPAEKKEIALKFSVEYPKEMQVTGVE
jgi:uncharacterized protein (TIGR02231 family)